MMETNNIEGVEQVVCALRDRYRGRDLEVKSVIVDRRDFQAGYFNEEKSGVAYYGIVTVGVGTTAKLNLFGGGAINIDPNNQIIELVTSIEAIEGDNVLFRGYVISLHGVVF